MSVHSASRARKSRICALQMLYQWEVGSDDAASVKKSYWREVRAQAPRDYADRLFDAATQDAANLDALIGKHSRHWKVTRLSAVDRNLLRLAIAESRVAPDLPPALVINETLEIAKQFSGEGATEFLNGVLDSILKEERGQTQ
jgi:N utilization substance protein B